MEFEEIYHLNSKDFDALLWGLVRLDPFHSDTSKPPMSAQQFVNLFKLMYGSRLRISEALNLEKQDFDLEHRILRIKVPKVMRYGEPTILPDDVEWLEKFLANYKDGDKIFPVTDAIVMQYAKDAARLAGLQIFEKQEDQNIKVFISYSFADKEIMKQMTLALNVKGIEFYTAEHDEQFGEPLDIKIQNAIRTSDVLIAIITKDNPSPSVDQEIGFAISEKIRIIPFVEEGAKLGVLLNRLQYLKFEKNNIQNACDKVANFIISTIQFSKKSEIRHHETGSNSSRITITDTPRPRAPEFSRPAFRNDFPPSPPQRNPNGMGGGNSIRPPINWAMITAVLTGISVAVAIGIYSETSPTQHVIANNSTQTTAINNSPGVSITNNFATPNSNFSGNNELGSLNHSELMAIYENDGPYYLKFTTCSTVIINYTNNNSVQLFLAPLMYDVKDHPTSIPFKVSIYYEFDGIKDSNVVQRTVDESNNPAPLIDPKSGIKQWSINLAPALEKASQNGITKVDVIIFAFTFAPFDTTDKTLIADPPPQNMTRLTLTELNFEDGNWRISGNNTICSQNLPMKLAS